VEVNGKTNERHFTDGEIQKAIQLERQKWRDILKCILQAIIFCAKNNLALSGSNDKTGAPNAGVFLDNMYVISYHNTALKDMISKHNAGSANYFSNKIQNEFVNLLGNKVQAEIIAEIKKAKYFSLLFDCTPHVSHHEQMSQIIWYVSVSDGNVSIQESFIDFIHAHRKTGNGLASEILTKLAEDGTDIENARGQCYDNAANMAGKYNASASTYFAEKCISSICAMCSTQS
jgi:hypothetical protein